MESVLMPWDSLKLCANKGANNCRRGLHIYTNGVCAEYVGKSGANTRCRHHHPQAAIVFYRLQLRRTHARTRAHTNSHAVRPMPGWTPHFRTLTAKSILYTAALCSSKMVFKVQSLSRLVSAKQTQRRGKSHSLSLSFSRSESPGYVFRMCFCMRLYAFVGQI